MVDVNHKFTSPIVDAGDPDIVGPDEWNDAHDMVQATDRILGRITALTGPTEELTPQEARDLLVVANEIDIKAYGAIGDEVTDDTVAVNAAVAAALAASADLYLSPGSYLITANITDFHNVRMRGPGRFLIGSEYYYPDGKEGTTNKLYVVPTGNDTNDGLAAGTAVATIQRAFDIFAQYAAQTTSNWEVILAAATTFSSGGLLDNAHHAAELRVKGNLNAGVPDTIIDVAGGSTNCLQFNASGRVVVQDVDVRNATLYGINYSNATRGLVSTCNGSGNGQADIQCTEASELDIVGVCNLGSTSRYGILYYRNSTGSIGNGSSAITIDGATDAGIIVRDGSKVVCENGLVIRNVNNASTSAGVRIFKDGYVELRTTTLENNSIGIFADTTGIYDNQNGVVTFTSNTLDKNFIGGAWDRSLLDAASVVPYWLHPYSNKSGTVPTSNYDLVLDKNGQVGIQALTGGNQFNIDCNKTTRFSMDPTANRITFVLDGVAKFRMRNNDFIPMSDNALDLGIASLRWREIFAANGTINTSDAREKTEVRGMTDAEIAAAKDLGREIGFYKFLASIEEKGGLAREHCGMTVQRVIEIMEGYDLDPFNYGFICFDEWDAEWEEDYDTGEQVKTLEAGDRYSFRPDQLNRFILRGMEARLAALESLYRA